MRNGKWAIFRRLAATATLLGAVSGALAAPPTVKVGELTLAYCNSDYDGYCGAIQRPLDPSGRVSGSITIGFEFYPHTDRAHPTLGTILPQEGGPGYSSTGSRDFYLGLFSPLRDRRDILIIDKRGTGTSDAINCPGLQNYDPNFLGSVAECGKILGPSAFLYGTDFAVNDLVAALDVLGIRKVDFYGDSYGTFVGQIFAGLYPDRLRSLILDSAYPVRAPDPWFGSDFTAAWNGIDVSCLRSPSCRDVGGSASARIRRLLDAVRVTPISGLAPNGEGVPTAVTVDTSSLFYLIDYAGYGPTVYRDLDSAARAWFDSGDALPLLRLVAETGAQAVSDPVDLSEGLFVAVECSDYPLLYDLNATPATRRRQYSNALAAANRSRANLFAPFTIAEALNSQTYITPLDSCLPWPAPPDGVVQGVPLAPAVQFPSTPTLVLSGDLDSVTSVVDASQTTAQFPNAVHVIFPNLPHVVAGTDEVGCAASIVLNFVRTRTPGETACTGRIRPIRTVPAFARSAADVDPLQPEAGNRVAEPDLRAASAAVEAVGDVFARYWVNYSGAGAGLRGGAFSYSTSTKGYSFVLDRVRWTDDVAVSGTIDWNTGTSVVTSKVTLTQGREQIGTISLRWTNADANAVVKVTGQLHGARLAARRIAP
jgi:pimeloyl-ACP methyl ester carboxylesterase